ncbi:MAG TPA: sigma-70 family RNA polymerase sigma factor [Clostridiaceae bacterium]
MKIDQNNFIMLLKKKKENALDYVIDTYGRLIKSIVKKHLYNFESFQDECFNDILLVVWYDIENFNDEKGSFQNWLAAVAKYKCIDYKRKYLKHLENHSIDNIDLSDNDQVERNLLENELSEDMESLLSSLKPQDKNIFLKYYKDEMNIELISKETGIKTSAIYNKLSRGRTRLKSTFENRH